MSRTASPGRRKIEMKQEAGPDFTISSSTDFTIPSSTDFTIPSSTDFTIPKSTDFTIPNSADFTIPSSTDLTIPSSHENYYSRSGTDQAVGNLFSGGSVQTRAGVLTSCKVQVHQSELHAGGKGQPHQSDFASGTKVETPHGNHSRHREVEESEFTIAADLTLYANPLRCLQKTAKPPIHHATSGPDMIAADLVKYGSPLDDKPNN